MSKPIIIVVVVVIDVVFVKKNFRLNKCLVKKKEFGLKKMLSEKYG